MVSRHRARIAVMETLYQLDSMFQGNIGVSTVESLCTEALERHGVTKCDSVAFGYTLARSSWEHRRETDRVIADLSRRWALHRIGRLERAIMRMALEEMWRLDIPPRVAINEAVELTKKYASDEAAAFVNGILGACVEGRPAEHAGPKRTGPRRCSREGEGS